MEPQPALRSTRPPGGDVGSSSLLRVVGLAAAAVLLLVVAFEFAERIWLWRLDPGLLDALHRVRSTAAALVAAGVATWLILREGPPILAAGVLPGERADGRAIDPGQKQVHYARWFILMRWVAVVVATIAVFITVEVMELLPRQVGPDLSALIALLTILNLGYAVYLRYFGAHAAFLALQVYADVLLLILLLHFSGGIENPLTPLLLLHVIIAGIVLGRAQAYLVAGFGSVLFALLAWTECVGILPHYTLRVFPHEHFEGLVLHAAHVPLYATSRVLLQTIVLMLVAYFTTTLVQRIQQDERELEGFAAHARAQTQMLERALETTGTALCLCDAELRTYWENQRWAEWQSQVAELRCGIEAPSSAARATLQDGRVRTTEIRTALPAAEHADDGGDRVFEVTHAPLRDCEDRIGFVVTLARDVTRQRAAQLHAMRAERLAGVGELAGQVAHEVNNPIAIISAKARLLLRGGREAMPAHAREEVVKIAELADRVARIAQGLLSYCRPSPGVRQPLDLRQPVRRALAYVEARAESAGVTVTDGLPAGLPPVLANAAELEQVFLNLFINALDAMPHGGTLRLHAQAQDGGGHRTGAARVSSMVVVQVTDSGTGIDAAIRGRVFEPFLTTKGGRGSGLGLSICQGIVRSHGGDIRLDSQPGCGTHVTIELPAASAAMNGAGAAVQHA